MSGATQDEVDRTGAFGQRLRALRRAAGLTQEELAERAGLTVNGVSALERGARSRPYPHTVRSLSQALGLSSAEQEDLAASVGARALEPPPREPRPVQPAPGAALPVPAAALVGRDGEVAELLGWLDDPAARLVTLTGPGGVGKTRLAAEVAARVGERRPGGVAFVGLAPVADPARVLPTIAEALALPEAAAALPALAAALGGRRLLLVLDNLEQVLDAAPEVAGLVASCPDLRVLVSSRAPLRVRGEREFQVRPLALPASTRAPRPGDVTGCAAGALFLQRARAVQADFEVTTENAAAVAAICWRLGGLPLALELAAPRVRTLAPQDLLTRLDHALSSGWARDLPARQHTMQATLDWSYDLLEEQERTLFTRLAVFSGGFSLAAVEALTADALDPGSVLGLLDRLVEQSLVVVVRGRRGTHYDLLEPIREYAVARLRATGGEDAARRAHAQHFLAVAEQAAPEYQGAQQVLWLERTEWESDNLRAAMTWALAAGEAETAARLGWAVWLVWWMRGHLQEGRAAMEQALGHHLSPALRVRALLVVASMAYAQGDNETARPRWAEALERSEHAGDVAGEAYSRAGLGLVAMATREPEAAAQRMREAIALAQGIGEQWMHSLASIWLGTILLVTGDPAGAAQLFEQQLAAARARGDRLVTYVALFNLAQALLARGEHAAAEHLLAEGVTLSLQTRDRANLAFSLDALAVVAAQQGRWRRCATLLGAAQAMREAVQATVHNYYLPDEALRARAAEDAREALGSAGFEEALAAGRAMGFEEAAEHALGAELSR